MFISVLDGVVTDVCAYRKNDVHPQESVDASYSAFQGPHPPRGSDVKVKQQLYIRILYIGVVAAGVHQDSSPCE